jgi:GntR family histidine utilization transcriptional repressor
VTSLPLHERIRSEIEAKILDGALAPGDRIPIEHELMRDYGCSRMTVSKALSALAASGLIERRKRAGSFVAQPRVHSMVLDIPDLASEVAGRGQSYEYRLIKRQVRPPTFDKTNEQELARGGHLLELRGLHLADGVPLAVEDRLISLAAVPDMQEADLSTQSPGAWLLTHVPWTEAETRISSVNADAETARKLKVSVGTACLSVERWTWRSDERVTQVRQLFVGSAYDLVARFGSGRSDGSAAV